MHRPHFYIHGLPGSQRESELFGKGNSENLLHLKPFDIKGQKDLIEPHERFSIAAFSLGSKTAFEIAASYSDKVEKLTLISPAAPLELGDFLPKMDGRMVFKAAQGNYLIYTLMTFGMGRMAHHTPQYLMKRMFGESGNAEQLVLQGENFQEIFCHGLRQSLIHERKQYMKAIREFGLPWAEIIDQIQCPVEIWHGTADTWAPFSMAEAIKARIGDMANLVTCEGLGHYSTLIKWSQKPFDVSGA